MKSKSIITIALLVFVAASVITLAAKEFGGNTTMQEGMDSAEAAIEDKVVVYYFHATARCVTCRTIEAYTNDALETTYAHELISGQIEFRVINVETPTTVHFIEDYQLYAPSVVLARFDDNLQKDWKNLDRVWQLVGDRATFLDYVDGEIAAMMQGGV